MLSKKLAQAFARKFEMHSSEFVRASNSAQFSECTTRSTPRRRTALLAGTEVFTVDGNKLLLCLAQPLSIAVIEAMGEFVAPEGTICVLDAGFAENDQLKVNAVETIRARERDRDQTITFRVL